MNYIKLAKNFLVKLIIKAMKQNYRNATGDRILSFQIDTEKLSKSSRQLRAGGAFIFFFNLNSIKVFFLLFLFFFVCSCEIRIN